jgi:hypothetical protein
VSWHFMCRGSKEDCIRHVEDQPAPPQIKQLVIDAIHMLEASEVEVYSSGHIHSSPVRGGAQSVHIDVSPLLKSQG